MDKLAILRGSHSHAGRGGRGAFGLRGCTEGVVFKLGDELHADVCYYRSQYLSVCLK